MVKIAVWTKRVVTGVAKWLWDNPLALASMVGAVLGGFLMWKRSTNKIASLEDAVQVQAIKVSIAKKTARADLLEEQADDAAEEVEVLKRAVVASKKRVVELHEGESLEGKDDEQIAELFSQAGL